MNTPAHLAASLLIWRNEKGWAPVSAITAGAILPDAPMFGFYFYQKLVAGSTEHDIWTTLYFDESWQLFFDVFNSMPLMILVLAISYACKFRWGVLLAASALLHLCCDLPLHHDDAHRHFLPFTNWRFESPVSYWDPKHFGLYFAATEFVFSIAACTFVIWKSKQWPMKAIATTTLVLYAVGITFAIVYWVPQLLG